MPIIYILHFRAPHAHARHYSGRCRSLERRLIRHAHGYGARLTQVLLECGEHWTLGLCARVNPGESAQTIEKWLKRQKHTRRYCPLCTPRPKRVPGTTAVDTANLPFPIDSETIRNTTELHKGDIDDHVRSCGKSNVQGSR